MSTVNLFGFPSNVINAVSDNGQKAKTSVNQTIQRPVYVSKSKGVLFIDEMHDHHIVNAFRRRLNDVVKEYTNQGNAKTIADVVEAFSSLRVFTLILNDEILNNLHVEAQKRGIV